MEYEIMGNQTILWGEEKPAGEAELKKEDKKATGVDLASNIFKSIASVADAAAGKPKPTDPSQLPPSLFTPSSSGGIPTWAWVVGGLGLVGLVWFAVKR